MINLLKNEYTKTYRKKGFIVLLIIMLAFTLLTNFIYSAIDKLDEIVSEDAYVKEDYEMAKQE